MTIDEIITKVSFLNVLKKLKVSKRLRYIAINEDAISHQRAIAAATKRMLDEQ